MIDFNIPLNGYDILNYAKALQISDFNIYYPFNNFETNAGVINLSINGSHYVAYYKNWYFDSFLTPPPEWIKQQPIEIYGYLDAYISPYSIQKVTESNCGWFCLHFLYQMSVLKRPYIDVITELIAK